MAARAMWKAEVALGTLRVPVKLYAAIQDRNIHFRLLHAKDKTPVVQQMVDSGKEEPVPPEKIRKGVEVEHGVYVLLTEEEQTALEPPESREIVVEQVVDREQVDERWFDRPYYLGPDGDPDRYFALAEALTAKDSVAISRWTMRQKRYAGAMHGNQGYLMLETLRFAEEIVPIMPLRPPTHRAPDQREIALAEQLIAALADEFDPDEYREAVLSLVESKAAGKIVQFPKDRIRKSSASLEEVLTASLKQNKR